MRVQIDIICILSAVALAIASACLISVWQGFSIFTGVFMGIASGMFTFRRYQKMQAYKKRIDDQKYLDAYIYADENYADFDPKNFAYSKKEEKQINANLRSLKSMFWAGAVLTAASMLLVVFGILMLIG